MLKYWIYGVGLLFASIFAVPLNAFSFPFSSTPSSAKERTLVIIKPNGVADRHIGDILQRYESRGLKIVGLKMKKMTLPEAQTFYAEHKNKPFYKDLTNFMASGPVVAVVLEGENAVAKNREIMGATDPQKAAKGTLRADYGKSIAANAVHGSDSQESAKAEILFFFALAELN